MTFAELKSLLEQIAGAVAKLRQTLETNNMDALPEALEQTRVALELINGYPEGPEKLKSDINQYPEEHPYCWSQAFVATWQPHRRFVREATGVQQRS